MSYNNRVCRTQGNIYKLAWERGYDLATFSEKYLASEFCNREMDSEYSSFHFGDAREIMEIVEGVTELQTGDNAGITGSDAAWAGEMYRWLAIHVEITSKELAVRIPFSVMANFFDSFLRAEEYEAIGNIIKDQYLPRRKWRGES